MFINEIYYCVRVIPIFITVIEYIKPMVVVSIWAQVWI